jgi:hypothetical protein
LTILASEFKKQEQKNSSFNISYIQIDSWTTHLSLECSPHSFVGQLFGKYDYQNLTELSLGSIESPLEEFFTVLPKRLQLLKIREPKRRLYLSHLLRILPARRLPTIHMKLLALLTFSDEEAFLREDPSDSDQTI